MQLFSEWPKIIVTKTNPMCIRSDLKKYSRDFEHPRFGCVMSVVALRDIKPGEEVLNTIIKLVVINITVAVGCG